MKAPTQRLHVVLFQTPALAPERSEDKTIVRVDNVATLKDELHRGADLILVPAEHEKAEELLELSADFLGQRPFLLLVPGGKSYMGNVRFGNHKWGFRWLEKMGRVWGLTGNAWEPHETYRKLLNRLRDGVVVIDPNGKIAWYNDGLLRMLKEQNRNDKFLLDKNWTELFGEEDRVRFEDLREQHKEGIFLSLVTQVGNGQIVEVDPIPKYNAEGELLGGSLVLRWLEGDGAQLSHSQNLLTLYSIISVMSSGHSFKDLAIKVLKKSCELMSFPSGGLLMNKGVFEQDRIDYGVSLSEDTVEWMQEMGNSIAETKRIKVWRELKYAQDVPLELKENFEGLALVLLKGHSEQIGCYWFLSRNHRDFSRDHSSLLISIANQTGLLFENVLYQDRKLQEEESRKLFYRDALAAVTRGKLVFCQYDELYKVWSETGSIDGEVDIVELADVPRARAALEKSLQETELSEEHIADLAVSVTELSGNVVKHADNGKLSWIIGDESVSVLVEDKGPGIDFAHIPDVVLTPGFSTAPSLGMGYHIIMQTMDRVLLATGSEGTAVMIELKYVTKDPLDALLERFPSI